MGKYAIIFLSLIGLATFGAAAPRHLSGPGGFAATPTGPPRESRYRTSSEIEPTFGESQPRTTSSAEPTFTVSHIDPDGTGTSDGYGPMPTVINGTFTARDVPKVTYYPTTVTKVPLKSSESCTTTVTVDVLCGPEHCLPMPGVSGVCTEFSGGHGTETSFPSATMITDYGSPPPFLSKTSLASLSAVTSTTTGEAEISTFPCPGNSNCV